MIVSTNLTTKDRQVANDETGKLTEDIVKIGEKIRDIRVSRNFSQAELAERIGARQPVVSRIEIGKHVPTWRSLSRIADALGASVTVDFIEEEVSEF